MGAGRERATAGLFLPPRTQGCSAAGNAASTSLARREGRSEERQPEQEQRGPPGLGLCWSREDYVMALLPRDVSKVRGPTEHGEEGSSKEEMQTSLISLSSLCSVFFNKKDLWGNPNFRFQKCVCVHCRGEETGLGEEK